MDKEVSKKITFLNYALICLIVLLHCQNNNTPDFSNVSISFGVDLIYKITNFFSIMAVPTFLGLSGYLFFRNCNKNTVKRKLIGRVKSVLIPYLIWNIGFYGVYALLNMIPFIQSKINFQMPEMNLYVLLFENYANPPLWFLPKLFLLQILSPIALFLFTKLKHFNLIWIAGFIIADLIFGFGYSSVLHWVAVYFGAGYGAFAFKDIIEEGKPFTIIHPVFRILIAIALLIAQIFFLQWILAPIFCWCILASIKKVPYKDFMKVSFFIFCTHYFLVLITRKILFLVLGASQISMVIIYFATCVVTILLLTLIGYLFKKFIPKVYSIMCGGR